MSQRLEYCCTVPQSTRKSCNIGSPNCFQMRQTCLIGIVHFFMSRALFGRYNRTEIVDDEVYKRIQINIVSSLYYVFWADKIDLKPSISPNQIVYKPKIEEVDKCLMWTLFQMAFVSTPLLNDNNDVCQKGWRQSSIKGKFALPCSLHNGTYHMIYCLVK